MEHSHDSNENNPMPLAKDLSLENVLLAGFHRSNDLMFYCDPEGVILDANDSFTAHYGYTRTEVIGKTPAILRSSRSTEER